MKIISIEKTMREKRGGYILYLVKLEDGMGVWKAYKQMDSVGPKDFVAYLVSEKFGFNIVPECQICEFNGLIGNVQRFIEGEDGDKYINTGRPIPLDEMIKLALFDYVINNYNRCLGNFRIDKNMKVYATDNNCAFCLYPVTAETIFYLFNAKMNEECLNIIKNLHYHFEGYRKLFKDNLNVSTIQIDSIRRHIFQLYKAFINKGLKNW